MSIENHPNINAAGFVTDVIIAFRKYLRGAAAENMPESVQILTDSGLVDFVNKVDENLDQKFAGTTCRIARISVSFPQA